MVPHILSGELNCSFKLAQGWTYHQVEFQNSYLGGINYGVHSLILFTPLNMIIFPCPYTEFPEQQWNPMLDSMNSVNSEA